MSTLTMSPGLAKRLEQSVGSHIGNRPMLRQAALYQEIQRLQHMVRAQADMIKDLEKSATEDALTGLQNRRGWDEAVAKAGAEFSRYGRDTAVVLIDLNFFKQVNDTYGHAVGDAMLQKVAETLEEYTRESDIVARPGGDEFCVLLKETDIASAKMKAAHLQDILNHTVCDVAGEDLTISASVGVANFSENDGLAETLDQADTRMYQAKQRVHNRAAERLAAAEMGTERPLELVAELN